MNDGMSRGGGGGGGGWGHINEIMGLCRNLSMSMMSYYFY